MKKEILNQLKSDYDNREIKPSADLWNRIESQMDETAVLVPKKPFVWMKYAAVVLLFISFGAVFYFNSKTSENNTLVENNNLGKDIKQPMSNVEIIKSNINLNENNVVISQKSKALDIQSTQKIINNHENSTINNQPLIFAKEEIIIKSDFKADPVIQEKIINQIVENPVVAERKKSNYIKAGDLLLGREFDKTRAENQDHEKSFGVLDMNKIKIKSPNSFKILGMTVYSDSLETK